MKILGIDPGTIVMGYGIIDCDGDDLTLVKFGAISVNERSPIGERLLSIHTELTGLIAEHRPDVVAVEQPFVAKNVRSALAIGRAQAMAMLAAAASRVPCFEYTPAEVKQRVASHGASSKEQVQEMVRLLLGLPQVPEPNDAADALAVAVCHVQECHLNGLLTGEQK
jgi:crossover junction endodeoxyribonuclease RuvC